MKGSLDARIKKIVGRHYPYDELNNAIEYVRNDQRSWFTCILYKGMNLQTTLQKWSLGSIWL